MIIRAPRIELVTNEVPVILSSGGTSQEIIADSIYNVTTDATIRYDREIIAGATHAVTFESENEELATVNEQGYVETQGSGLVIIYCRSQKCAPRHILHDARIQSNNSAQIFYNFKTGTLGRLVADTIDAWLNVSTDKVFYTEDVSARNENCWIDPDFDLTCRSIWNSDANNKKTCVAITPRHVISQKHFRIRPGSTVKFLDSEGTIHTRTLVNWSANLVPSASSGYGVLVGILDSNLPGSITPAKLFPSTFPTYIPGYNNGVPLIIFDQEYKALVAETKNITLISLLLKYPTATARLAVSETLVGGDSNQPWFMFDVDGAAVIVGGSSFGGAGIGYTYHNLQTEITSAIASLGAHGHTISLANLTGLETF